MMNDNYQISYSLPHSFITVLSDGIPIRITLKQAVSLIHGQASQEIVQYNRGIDFLWGGASVYFALNFAYQCIENNEKLKELYKNLYKRMLQFTPIRCIYNKVVTPSSAC